MHTYHVSTINVTKLPKIAALPIERQEAIKMQFGSPLSVTRLIELIRDSTADFQLEIPQAIEADKLIKRFLEKKGFGETAAKPVEKTALKTTKSSAKQILEIKIKGFKAALPFAEGRAKEILETKIKGFEAALKFA